MKIITKTKTSAGLEVHSSEKTACIYASVEEKIYISITEFVGKQQIGLSEEFSHWDEDNIFIFDTVEECHQFEKTNNLTKYINLNEEYIM